MSNNYIPDMAALAPGQQAQSSQVNDRYSNTVAGFDKLPAPASGKKGFSEPCPVGTPTDSDHAVTKDYMENTWLTPADKVQLHAIDAASLDAVSASAANVDAVATDIANVNAAAGSIANVNAVASIAGDVTAVGGISADVTIAASNIADIQNANSNATTALNSKTQAEAAASQAEEWANKAEDSLVSAAAGGDGVDDYSAKHYATKAALSAGSVNNVPYSARNCVLNQEAVTQGQSTRTGISSTKYTGNDTGQSVVTGVDMATGDFGGLVWVKSRSGAASHILVDSVRGANSELFSNSTGAESVTTDRVTSFDATGFTLGATTAATLNANGSTYVAWSLQTTEKTTGVTNRNKPYTCHYNPQLGFSIVGFEGDGTTGHEIPTHLPKQSELSLYKNRSNTDPWIVQTPEWDGTDLVLFLHTTSPLSNTTTDTVSITTDESIIIGADSSYNGNTNDIISYHFHSVPGVSKIGKYVGTGAAGNYVDCGFKAGWVMIKNLTTGITWTVFDSIRGDTVLQPNLSDAETPIDGLDFIDSGFVIKDANTSRNATNDEYLFMAFAETSLDGTKSWTDYEYPTTADTLTIEQGSQISGANGFDAKGPVDVLEVVGAGTTFTLGAGYEDKTLWFYKNIAGTFGVTENRNLEGMSRNDADEWGEVSPLDPSLRTTAKHSGHESSTGVVTSSAYAVGYEDYNAFNFKANDVTGGTATYWQPPSGTTVGTLQYKFDEERILKSWRLRGGEVDQRNARRFTVDISTDGFNWVTVSDYSSSDFANTSNQWSPLEDVSSNTTLAKYVRINITANHGDASFVHIGDFELNTVLPSDYYNVQSGVMYDSADAPIQRVYLAKIITDTNGDVAAIENLPVSKAKFNDVEVHGDLKVRGEINSEQTASAWVNFDGSVSPPLIRDSFNVSDIIKTTTGTYNIIFDNPMDNIDFCPVATADSGSVNVNMSGSLGVDHFNVQTRITSTNSVVDVNKVSIVVFGGKS